MDKTYTILDWLTRQYPQAHKTTLRLMVAHKRVLLNGVPALSLKQEVAPQDKVSVADITGKVGLIGRGGEGVRVVYQDADVMVINKPAGLLTSTHSKEPRPTVIAVLNSMVQRNNQKAAVMLVHRLDKDASGLLVFAKNQTALTKLKAQFEEHSVEREYTLVVHGVPKKPQGRLENMLVEKEGGEVEISRGEDRQAKKAVLNYQVLSQSQNLALLRCRLETGRKHQIRVQLRHLGHPLCGDVIYGTIEARRRGAKGGFALSEPPHRLALHASHLGFKHPSTGKLLRFDSPAPESFAQCLTLPAKAAPVENNPAPKPLQAPKPSTPKRESLPKNQTKKEFHPRNPKAQRDK